MQNHFFAFHIFYYTTPFFFPMSNLDQFHSTVIHTKPAYTSISGIYILMHIYIYIYIYI